MTTKEKIEVMQAYEDGKTIEARASMSCHQLKIPGKFKITVEEIL